MEVRAAFLLQMRKELGTFGGAPSQGSREASRRDRWHCVGAGRATLPEENLTHLCQTVTRLGSSREVEEQRLGMDSA